MRRAGFSVYDMMRSTTWPIAAGTQPFDDLGERALEGRRCTTDPDLAEVDTAPVLIEGENRATGKDSSLTPMARAIHTRVGAPTRPPFRGPSPPPGAHRNR